MTGKASLQELRCKTEKQGMRLSCFNVNNTSHSRKQTYENLEFQSIVKGVLTLKCKK